MLLFILFLVQCMILRTNGIPTVTSLTPGGVILSGGLGVTVTGSGLTDDTQPEIVITGSYTNGSSTATAVFTGTSCTVTTATSLICPSPQITLTDFINAGYIIPSGTAVRKLNDATLTFRIGVSWATVKSEENFTDVTVYKDPSLSMENPIRTYTVWTNRIVKIYGLDLDKYVTDKSQYDVAVSDTKCESFFLNSSQLKCLLSTSSPTPNAADNKSSLVAITVGGFSAELGRIQYKIPTFRNETASLPQIFIPRDVTDVITINGFNFKESITSGSTYYVQVGQGECTILTLTSTRITCRPPDTQPLQLSNYPERDSYPQIVVTVPRVASAAAHQYTEHVGYVQYSNQWVTASPTDTNTGDSNSNTGSSGPGNFWTNTGKWVLLGLAFFLGLLFLAMMIVCLCCTSYFKNRQWRSEKQQFYVDERNHSAHSSFRSYQSKRNSSPHSSFRSYQSQRNTTPRSSLRSYQSKTTGSSYLQSDGSREYYVTETRLPIDQLRY